ncbi:3-hydroxyacyl-CoA dehydrogenase family protein [Jiangella aurantiaca]|uniref:3-hydroxyacyl-CoA dehydrogenase family protein n=1 Tax=Jiangella aurantiaca TaxID=2530373 RepID=A0A4R5ADE8_9ACTN|nr:3-hydroxybutyryl-CoA dehydrogenase [Jiangella aurantiaca]TDD67882.1 3-hydroxyacyl-CoA dehydrogenase family protein [Jiangella aurantiaca]
MSARIARVGVVGLGTMGAGIAEVFSRAGLDVVGVERDDAALAAGRGHVDASTGRAVRRGKLTADEQAALVGRIEFTTDLAALGAADLVVEAVPERLEIKRDLFGRLDGVVSADTILATNTSSLSVTAISVAVSRPERVVGLHFFNPAPVQELIEVVRTVVTAPEVIAAVTELARRLGKTPVECGDRAGFVTNALLFGYLNRAAAMFESGHASREDIDAAITAGLGYPMGPLALLDLIGLDTAYEILETMYRQGRNRLHTPAPILGQLVTLGFLGRKTGRGFYDYSDIDGVGASSAVVTPEDSRVHRVAFLDPSPGPLAEALAKAGHDVVRGTAGQDADLVVAPGDPETFARIAADAAPGAVLAATGAGPVVASAAASGRPADVVGLHLAGPAATVAEVVRTVVSSPSAVTTVAEVAASAGLTAVVCADRAGFVVDALLVPYLNDAVAMLETGYASAADVDTAMRLGCRLPAGPFELLDALGPAAALATLERLQAEVREPGLAPSPLLTQLATAGLRFADL